MGIHIVAQLAEADRQKSKELTLLGLAGEWLRDGVTRKDGNAELRRKFAKDLYPALAQKSSAQLVSMTCGTLCDP
jgi:hypothetical protein